MIHPFFCYLGVICSFALSLYLFVTSTLDVRDFFYLPIVLLIAYYTVHAVATDTQTYETRRLSRSIVAGLGRYVFWACVLLAIIGLYHYHPAYRAMTTNTRRFFVHFLGVFLVCGWPYFFLADRYRYCLTNALSDPYVTVSLLLRHFARGDRYRLKRRLFSRQTRRLLSSTFLRIHFIPVMFEQVYLGAANFTLEVQDQAWPSILLLTTLAWLIDSNNASIGYFWESRFTRTCFRDMDPYPFHWLVTLACYVPFIYFVSGFVAEFPVLPEDSQRLFGQSGVNFAIDLAMVVILACYVASGSAMAFSYSNLSYKKIQTKGIYGVIRHPAITFKIIWFTLAFYRFSSAYTIGWFLCYVSWMGIYVCRAFVEERFLRRFPDYRVYMQKTKYRFIPGVL